MVNQGASVMLMPRAVHDQSLMIVSVAGPAIVAVSTAGFNWLLKNG